MKNYFNINFLYLYIVNKYFSCNFMWVPLLNGILYILVLWFFVNCLANVRCMLQHILNLLILFLFLVSLFENGYIISLQSNN